MAKKETRQKCSSDESTCVLLYCFVFDFFEPFAKFLGKNKVFCRTGFSKRTFSLKIGFAPKRACDNFSSGKKKNGTVSGDALPEHGFRVFREETDETTVNVVYSVSVPKTNFCRRLFEN